MPRVVLSGDAPRESRRLRDAGHEVIALSEGSSAEQVAAIAVQEDVVAVAVADPEVGRAVAEELAEVVVFWVTSKDEPSSPPEHRG